MKPCLLQKMSDFAKGNIKCPGSFCCQQQAWKIAPTLADTWINETIKYICQHIDHNKNESAHEYRTHYYRVCLLYTSRCV